MGKGNEPAYPTQETKQDERSGKIYEITIPGLTKREYFAGLALQALVSNSVVSFGPEAESCQPYVRANQAVQLADALLKELEKGSE